MFIIEYICEKVCDFFIERYYPWRIKTQPRRIEFINSNWTSKESLVITNEHTLPFFSIYILGTILNGSLNDLVIESPRKNNQEFVNEFGGIILDYNIIRINGKDSHGNPAFIIKLSSIEQGGNIYFQLKSAQDLSIKMKVLKYERKPEQILVKNNEVAIPLNLPIKFTVENMVFLLRKES